MKNIYFLLAACLTIASCGPTTVIHSDNYQPAPELLRLKTCPISLFTTSYHLMGTGSTIRVMGMSGCPMPALISGHMPVMETGSIRMPDGPGLPITTGDGHHFIMAVGFMKTVMDGCGFPEMNGHQPG